MKTLRKASFFVLVGLVATTTTATTCRAQTAEEIVAKNIEAVGGKTVVDNTKSIVITNSLEVMGNEVPSTTTFLVGKGFKNETEFNGTKIIQVVTDHGGWTLNPMAGQSAPTAMKAEDAKSASTQLFAIPFSNISFNDGKIELAGKDTADYKIKYTNNTGLSILYYINMKTYLIDKEDVHRTANGQDVDILGTFSDYRKIDNGLLIPWKVTRELPQYTLNFTVQKVEVNKDIDPSAFEMPK